MINSATFFDVLDLLLKYWAIVTVVVVWLLGRLRAFFRARADRKKRDAQHDQLLVSINGVGKKLGELEKKVDANHTDDVKRHGEVTGEVKWIKGKLEGMNMNFPFQRNGERQT